MCITTVTEWNLLIKLKFIDKITKCKYSNVYEFVDMSNIVIVDNSYIVEKRLLMITYCIRMIRNSSHLKEREIRTAF